MSFWTYMLHCRGGRYYIGHTDNLEQRIGQHETSHFRGFTADHVPVKLVWSEYFGTRLEALECETKLKGWSRAKKMALIRGDWDRIRQLAKSRGKGKDGPSTSSGRTDGGCQLKSVEAPPNSKPVRAELVEASSFPSAQPRPFITLIVARADNRVIGKDGKLPWSIPADLKRFKALTMGAPIIMGRKTFESLLRLLPGREHIVLTTQQDWQADGVTIVHSVEEALQSINVDRASVIGGEHVYRAFLPLADRIELTEVHCRPNGDAFMPPISPAEWRKTRPAHPEPADGDRPAYRFTVYDRKART